MHIFSIVLQVILGLGFLFFSFMKFGSPQMADNFKHHGYPQWFRVFTGIVELVTGIGFIAGIWSEPLAAWAGVLAGVTMVGAVVTHLRSKDPAGSLVMPIVLLLLSVFAAILNF